MHNVMHNVLESRVLSHISDRKLIPGLMTPLFSSHLMKLHLKSVFLISLKRHKSALRQNGYIMLTLALHVLIQTPFPECFLNWYFLFIKKVCIQIISPNLLSLCLYKYICQYVFINTYANRKERIVVGRNCGLSTIIPKTFLSLKPFSVEWLKSEACSLSSGALQRWWKKIRVDRICDFVQKFGFQYQLSHAHFMKRQHSEGHSYLLQIFSYSGFLFLSTL